MIYFELPFLLPTLNQQLRTNRWKRGFERNALAWQVKVAIGRQMPIQPILHAHISVERHTFGTLDPDGLPGSCKALLDVLQPFSTRHPAGLGVIAGDDPARLVLQISVVKLGRNATQRTIVTIEEREK